MVLAFIAFVYTAFRFIQQRSNRKTRGDRKKEMLSMSYISANPVGIILNLCNRTLQEDYLKLATEEEIYFGKIPFGSTYNEVIKIRKKPYYNKVTQHHSTKVRTILYKTKMGTQKRIVIYYFIEDQLVFGEYKYPNIPEKEIEMYKKILTDKYKVETTDVVNDFYIENIKRSTIHFIPGRNLTIKYICSSDVLFDMIKHDLQKFIDMEKTEIANSYIYEKIYKSL